jgi:hypothetical protein
VVAVRGVKSRKKFGYILNIDQFFCNFLLNFAQILNLVRQMQAADDLDVLRIRLPPFKKKERPRIVG